MELAPARSALLLPVASLPPLPLEAFREAVAQATAAGARPMALWARPGDGAEALVLTALLYLRAGRVEVLRGSATRGASYRSLTVDHPAFQLFERELAEQYGLRPEGHPWLKPVRFEGAAAGAMAAYPFYKLGGKDVHEVGVGPIHAGVIEPGHFRFMCLGETVHHLEIQLGYQHRGVEALLLQRDPRRLTPLVETIAGDSSVAYAWGYAAALEALAQVEVAPDAADVRGVALELERVGMHLAGLAGLATDIAFLQGASTYGRIRTAIINASMRLGGSRFGRGWLRPGGVRAGIDADSGAAVLQTLQGVAADLALVNDLFEGARSVLHRLRGVGVVAHDLALQMGLTGPSARASGIDVDLRTQLTAAHSTYSASEIKISQIRKPSKSGSAAPVAEIRCSWASQASVCSQSRITPTNATAQINCSAITAGTRRRNPAPEPSVCRAIRARITVRPMPETTLHTTRPAGTSQPSTEVAAGA